MTPVHVLNFANFKIAELQKRKVANRALYDKAMAEFDALPFYKKLYAGHPSDSGWEFRQLSHWIEDLEDKRLEALYAVKMDYPSIDIDDTWHRAFYKWAEFHS